MKRKRIDRTRSTLGENCKWILKMETPYWRPKSRWNHIIEMENCVVNFQTEQIFLGTGTLFVNTVMNLLDALIQGIPWTSQNYHRFKNKKTNPCTIGLVLLYWSRESFQACCSFILRGGFISCWIDGWEWRNFLCLNSVLTPKAIWVSDWGHIQSTVITNSFVVPLVSVRCKHLD